MPRARWPLGVLGAGPPAISRRESLPRRVLGAASSAVATPRVAPGPAHAGSQVAPAYGDAFRAAIAGMGPRIRLGTGRAGAVARGAQVVPRLRRTGRSGAVGRRFPGVFWVACGFCGAFVDDFASSDFYAAYPPSSASSRSSVTAEFLMIFGRVLYRLRITSKATFVKETMCFFAI